jgi:tetratricopeptide (TPR) repeat protein
MSDREMTAYDTEFDQQLERARALLGATDAELPRVLPDANDAVNSALVLRPDSPDAWLVKCQVASAGGDDHAALAATEMALHRAPGRAEALYWHGAVLGDLGRHREALRAIEAAFATLTDGDRWLLEDLHYEKIALLGALGLPDAAAAARAAGLADCPGSALLRIAGAPIRPHLKIVRGG